MNAWWDGLSGVLKVLYLIAIPSTLALLIQTVMVMFSFGDGVGGGNPSDTSGLDLPDTDLDGVGADGADLLDTEALDGVSDFGTLRLFTLQGIVALLTTFSWVAICLIRGGMQLAPAMFLSALCGVAMMYLVAKLMQWSAKLAENGTFNVRSTIGETAQVYVMIPASGESGGKVTLTMTSGFVELDAVTQTADSIPAGSTVRIVDLQGDVVVVERC
ncbi:MAG: NfeD family protein [Lachnospiraceae bacterium]|nr:NfeD family protein [Lachnospiraceae bacterium]